MRGLAGVQAGVMLQTFFALLPTTVRMSSLQCVCISSCCHHNGSPARQTQANKAVRFAARHFGGGNAAATRGRAGRTPARAAAAATPAATRAARRRSLLRLRRQRPARRHQTASSAGARQVAHQLNEEVQGGVSTAESASAYAASSSPALRIFCDSLMTPVAAVERRAAAAARGG